MILFPSLFWGLSSWDPRVPAKSKEAQLTKIAEGLLSLDITHGMKYSHIYKGEKTLGYGNIIRFKVKKLGLSRNIFHNQV